MSWLIEVECGKEKLAEMLPMLIDAADGSAVTVMETGVRPPAVAANPRERRERKARKSEPEAVEEQGQRIDHLVRLALAEGPKLSREILAWINLHGRPGYRMSGLHNMLNRMKQSNQIAVSGRGPRAMWKRV
jgi:hypothetical protein